jgi:hypothetical protein
VGKRRKDGDKWERVTVGNKGVRMGKQERLKGGERVMGGNKWRRLGRVKGGIIMG